MMLAIITKYLFTAGMVVIISEVAKRSDKWGGLLAALPLITLFTLILLHIDKQPLSTIANHAKYTFWYVVPTLPMFLLFPYILPKMGFWAALAVSIVVTLLVFMLFATLLAAFGIKLL